MRLVDIGYHLPEQVLTNEMLQEEVPEYNVKRAASKIGVTRRHVADGESILFMALKAAQQVVDRHDLSLIDYVILCTQSSEYHLPNLACILQERLGLRTDIGALDINLGCSGYVYGLSLANGLLFSNQANQVLLVTSEAYTQHIAKEDAGNRMIFGDGATATLVSYSLPHPSFVFGTDGRGAENLIVPRYGTLTMNGAEIFAFTIQEVPKAVREVVSRYNLELDAVDYFIFHQANHYMLDHLRRTLKIPQEKFYNDIRYTGNTVSSSIPLALRDCMERRVVSVGDKVLLCGFGVGYSWAATILEV
jgi:3-oxoacyl-[acyl-carrier-protein] synthase-3